MEAKTDIVLRTNDGGGSFWVHPTSQDLPNETIDSIKQCVENLKWKDGRFRKLVADTAVWYGVCVQVRVVYSSMNRELEIGKVSGFEQI